MRLCTITTMPLTRSAFFDGEFTLTDSGDAERVGVEIVSPSYFQMLGINAALGRVFLPQEDKIPGGHPVALVGDGLWRRRFGTDSRVPGQDHQREQSPAYSRWRPALGFQGAIGVSGHLGSDDDGSCFGEHPQPPPANRRFLASGGGTAKAGVNPMQAQERLTVLEPQIEASGSPSGGIPSLGIKVSRLHEALTDPAIRKSLFVLFGAVTFVVLIACVNVASLLLARGSTRQREFAIRIAVGASRARLLRQLLTESLLLGLLAGIVALLIAKWGINLLAALQPATPDNPFASYTRLPEFSSIHLETPVLAFNLLLSVFTAMVFGLMPARKSSRPDLNKSLKESSTSTPQGAPRLSSLGGRKTLVVVEVGLALMLLVGAGLMIRSLARLLSTRLGFAPENLVTVKIDLPQTYSEAAGSVFLPAACGSSFQPAGGGSGLASPMRCRWPVPTIEPTMSIDAHGITRTLATHGRSSSGKPGSSQDPARAASQGPRRLSDQDRAGSRIVAVLNGTAALKYWRDEDPLGQQINLGIGAGPNGTNAEIVGVVGDVKYDSVDAEVGARDVYLSYLQSGYPGYFLANPLAPKRLDDGPSPSPTSGRTRQGHPHLRRRHHGATLCEFHLAGPVQRPSAGHVRGLSADARHHRHLWRHFVFGRAAHPRDWNPDGSGGRAKGCAASPLSGKA